MGHAQLFAIIEEAFASMHVFASSALIAAVPAVSSMVFVGWVLAAASFVRSLSSILTFG